jgi:hypothetical protein
LAQNSNDTLSIVGKIVPIKLLKNLYTSRIDSALTLCLDNNNIECKQEDIGANDYILKFETLTCKIIAEVSNRFEDKNYSVWRLNIYFLNAKDISVFMNHFPAYIGYEKVDDENYHSELMQTIKVQPNNQTNGSKKIEIWLDYPIINRKP